MDQETPQAPEIKTEVNKREERKSGFFVTLLSKLTGSASATGGMGAGGAGLGGAAVSGGLLATKAGVVALVVAGSTVAGGLGLVGYKVLGSQASSQKGEGQFNSAFEVRPQEAAPADIEAKAEADAKAAAAARAEGTSSSLQFLAQANQNMSGTPPVEEKKPEAEAAPVADAAASAGIAPLVNNNAPAAGTSAKTLAGTKKIGQLSSGSSGGSSGGATAAAPGSGAGAAAGAMPHTAIAGARLGNSSGMGAGVAGRSAAGKSIARAGSRPRGPGPSMAFAHSALRANTGRVLGSAPAGVTYDGGAAASSMAGPDNAKADGGVNPGNEDKTKPKPTGATPGSTPHDALEPDLPNVAGTNVTPWQKSVNRGKMLLMGSVGFMLLASKLIKAAMAKAKAAAALVTGAATVGELFAAAKAFMFANKILKVAWALLATATVAGLGALAIGMQISGGQYNQKAAGLSFILGGAFAATASMIALLTLKTAWVATANAAVAVETAADTAALQSSMGGLTTHAAAVQHGKALALPSSWQATTTADVAAIQGGSIIDPLAGGSPIIMNLCGAAAIGAVVMAYLTKPKQLDAAKCRNNGCRQNSYNYKIPSPSENVLSQYLS